MEERAETAPAALNRADPRRVIETVRWRIPHLHGAIPGPAGIASGFPLSLPMDRRRLVLVLRVAVGRLLADLRRAHRIAQRLLGTLTLAPTQFVGDQFLRLTPSLCVAA